METLGKFHANDGDWICSDPSCGNLNFARRTACNRCNKEKEVVSKKRLSHQIGKAAAEKSKGLFSADDWSCNKCCNINWARRSTCNICNAPKFADLEERTGYGGGFNDRGVVEYVKRDDSDDEYDEFGRRRKKSSKSNDANDTKIPKLCDYEIEEDLNGEEEEDDEEEDDSEDLSKYDLSDWGDPVDQNDDQKSRDRDAKTNCRKLVSERRSRSRSPN